PAKPVWSLFEELEDFGKAAADPALLPVGYNGDSADVYSIPLRHTYCWMIWGGKRTGKTNLMKVCIQSALKKDCRIGILDSPEGLYSAYAEEEKVSYAADEESVFNFFAGMTPVFKERNQLKRRMASEDMEEDEIFARMAQETPWFIFIADMAWFAPFIYNAERKMSGFMENILSKGELHNIYFISEIDPDNTSPASGYGLYESFIGYKTGVHMGGHAGDNPSLSFEYLSYTEQMKAGKAGTGQLPDSEDENAARKLVVPLARR
ncbi:MAG TPA: hypothetical protein DF613_09765, partial [Lachnospiraceae bacterium]|nr:hypothetical protein [Lachnospiraceae bacterium]